MKQIDANLRVLGNLNIDGSVLFQHFLAHREIIMNVLLSLMVSTQYSMMIEV